MASLPDGLPGAERAGRHLREPFPVDDLGHGLERDPLDRVPARLSRARAQIPSLRHDRGFAPPDPE